MSILTITASQHSKETIETFSNLRKLTEQSQKLTTAEKVAKWSLKIFVMIGGVALGTLLTFAAATLFHVSGGILGNFVDPAVAGGFAFIATMKTLQTVDEYFADRAVTKFLASQQQPDNAIAE